jgi:hypothetical protein
MQGKTMLQAIPPNRRERRRIAALTKRPVRPICACCQPTQGDEHNADAADVPSSGGLNPA